MKYRLLTDQTLELECGTLLFRIQALRDIHHPVSGLAAIALDLGGWVYSKEALSQEGESWVSMQAQIVEGRVMGDALVSGYAQVFGGVIKDKAVVSDCAVVSGKALVAGESFVLNKAKVIGHGKVLGTSLLLDQSVVEDDGLVINAKLTHQAKVSIGGEARDCQIVGDYVVQRGGSFGINQGSELPFRYGCYEHSNNYEKERMAYKNRSKWKRHQWVERFLPYLTGKKYRLIANDSITIQESGVVLYRIQALKAIDEHKVKRGDLGGYVESEANLSQIQGAWVAANSKVYGDALVTGCALVTDMATVSGHVTLSHECIIKGEAIVDGSACVMDKAQVRDKAVVRGEKVVIAGNSIIKDNASIFDHAQVHDYSIISANATLTDNAQCRGKSSIGGNVEITGPLPRHTVLN